MYRAPNKLTAEQLEHDLRAVHADLVLLRSYVKEEQAHIAQRLAEAEAGTVPEGIDAESAATYCRGVLHGLKRAYNVPAMAMGRIERLPNVIGYGPHDEKPEPKLKLVRDNGPRPA